MGSSAGIISRDFARDLALLARLSQPRGQDAAGVAVSTGDGFHVLKRGVPAERLVNLREWRALIDGLALAGARWAGAIGICRLATSGTVTLPEHNQPVVVGSIVGVHNGVIVPASFGPAGSQAATDSAVLFQMMERFLASGETPENAARRAFGEIEGSATVIFGTSGQQDFVAATNTGDLFVGRSDRARVVALASERAILESFTRSSTLIGGAPFKISAVPAGTGVTFSPGATARRDFAVPLSRPRARAVLAPRAGPARRRSRAENSLPLQRCTRCILPETHPFIEFDADGVCNLCRNWSAPKLAGMAALTAILDQHRSKDGDPDCIIAFSGGRDSSYGLHLLKAEFGMRPLALTYDWGLVTDVGRRNQARMCSTLGVHHVVRAANIEAKRRYVRENVLAWLKRPHLGMLPLFSAGDKQVYSHARKLRKETGIRLVVFCSHELETTEFKTGFCGMRENMHRNVLYRFSAMKKLHLAAWFAGQYVLNPRYLNGSFADSLAAYASTFIGRDDFLYLFHHVPWRESEVVGTLTSRYGWEPDPDTGGTWRNGDGYTAFTNYIYSHLAGFSEYDVLLSNEVRVGTLTRERALQQAALYNKPQAQLADFARWIGLDLDWLLDSIDALPPLRRRAKVGA